MKNKLALNDTYDRRLVYISWFIEEEGDFGATVGDAVPKKNATDADEIEVRVAYDALKPLADGKDHVGFYWESVVKARAALAVAKGTLDAHRKNRPIEDWEKKALAAGWKAPRGWR